MRVGNYPREVVELREGLRRRVWDLLEERGVAVFPRPVHGRIPSFKGADEAAARLINELKGKRIEAVFVNPDAPQAPVRRRFLEEGVKIYVSTPRISKGFILLDPINIPRTSYGVASTIGGMFKYGVVAHPREMDFIDIFIAGSVVVDYRGGRLGKGEGYSELEYSILSHFNLVDDRTLVATTIHDLQLVDVEIPLMPWDLTVDLISTPTRTIWVSGRRQRPRTVECRLLPRRKILEIPLLKEICLKS